MKVTITATLILLCVQCNAQGLPDRPRPHTADAEFIATSGALVGAWTADAISTDSIFDAGGSEHGAIFHNSRNAAQVMGGLAAVDAGAVITSYEWKKHVHCKWAHWAWRIPLYVQIGAHSEGAAHNFILLSRSGHH